MEESLPGRSADHRQDAIFKWRPAHHHWGHTGNVSWDLRWSFLSVLGAAVDAGNVRPDRLQTGGPQCARDRELRVPETGRYAATGAGRAVEHRAAIGERLSGNESRPWRRGPAFVAKSI